MMPFWTIAIWGFFLPITKCLRAEIDQDQELTLSCPATQSLLIESARYWAPEGGFLCFDLINAFQLTKDHCDFKESCSLDTTVGAIYADPCLGQTKRLAVIYQCTRVAEKDENSVLTLDCSTTPYPYLVIKRARYWAPDGGALCGLLDVTTLTRDKCDYKESCTLDTTPGALYLDPCLGVKKKLAVSYDCSRVAQIGENSVLNLDCSEKYLVIEGAKYWAPDGILCLELPDAFQLTRDHCDLKESCSLNTTPGEFYGDPCWLVTKKLAVSYTCTCKDGLLLERDGSCLTSSSKCLPNKII
ncbi:hypothetical protein ACHWQZ_G015008 [Mnemiopsis leidyi]